VKHLQYFYGWMDVERHISTFLVFPCIVWIYSDIVWRFFEKGHTMPQINIFMLDLKL